VLTAILGYPGTFEAGASQVGGKAWNLARLARWGYPVPRGVVVAIGVYDAVIADPLVAALVAEAGAIAPGEVAFTDANTLLGRLRAAIEAAPLPDPVEAALEQALSVAGIAGRPVAVRSSATGEDGNVYAFAGIHESFLNVEGVDAILASVKRCFASLWTPQALAYRRRFAIDDAEVRCGVVICEMITVKNGSEPLAAGVAFTADPRDGRRDHIVIETVAGLGDKLVSGQKTPERATVAVMLASLGPPQGRFGVLPSAIVSELAMLAWRIHWDFGDGERPQDIEWAFDGDQIFIVQTRPITALPRRTFPAILDQDDVWTNANFKEVSGALTPTTLSCGYSLMVERFLDLSRLSGYREPQGARFLRCVEGRLYFNASFLQYAWYDAWGMTPSELNEMLGGFQGEIRIPPGNPRLGLVGLRRLVAGARLLFIIWRLMKKQPAENRKLRERGRAFLQRDLSLLSDAELIQFWIDFSGTSGEWRVPFSEANAVGGSWLGAARELAMKYLPADRVTPLLGGLMSGQGGVISADHGYQLQEIVARCGTSGPEFDAALKTWLETYGHRGFDELEMANPRWGETPDVVVQLARDIGSGTKRDPAAAQRIREEAIKELDRLPRIPRRILHWLAVKAAQGFGLREDTKSAGVMIVTMTRRIFLETGRRMALRGAIDQPEDVFMLYRPDIMAFLMGQWQGAGGREKVRDHTALRAAQLACTPPDVIIEAANGVSASAKPLPAAAVPGERILKGLAASPGQARGAARKLDHPGQAALLREGGILVARTTDPGWTPLFLLAQAVVVEIGGYLSHGAIVAREFGIPSVINIPGGFDSITQGAEISVDGDAGEVALVD